jgi:hypothetical protein
MVTKNVQKSGKAYFVYLPKKWAEKAGKEVYVKEDERGNLVLSSDITKKQPLELTLTVKEYSLKLLRRLVLSCYIAGYDRVTINLEKAIKSKELLRYMKEFEEGGLEIGLLDFKPNKLSFYVSKAVPPLNLTFKRYVESILNSMRARGDDITLAKHFEREARRLKMEVLRARYIVLRDSSLAEEGVELRDYVVAGHICNYLSHIEKVLFEKSTKNALDVSKKLLELLLVMIDKPSIDILVKYDGVLSSLKHKEIHNGFKKIHREMMRMLLFSKS